MLSTISFTPSCFLRFILFVSFTFMLLGHNLFDRKVLFVNFVLLVLFNIKYIPNLFLRLINNLPLLFVLVWCLISVTWSSWAFKSFEEALVQLMLFFTCLMIANTFSTQTIFKIFKSSAAFVIVINLLAIPMLGSSAFSDAGMLGIYSHKNSFGLIMAICLLVLLYDYLKEPSKIVFGFIFIGVVLLILSISKTSIVLFLIVTIFTHLIKNISIKSESYIIQSTRVFLFFSLILVTILAIVYKREILEYLYYNVDLEFMTGRGSLWLTMLLHAEDNLTFGFGFNSVWGKGEFSEIYFTELYDTNPLWVESLAASDGGYIDLVISLGIVGFSIFLFYIFNTILMLVASKKSHNFSVLFSLFFFVVIHNFTETTFLLSTNVLWFIAILISFLAYNETGKVHSYNV